VEVLVSDSIKQTVTSDQAAQQCYRDMVAMIKDHGYCVVTIKAGSRSLEQNALYWEWLTVIADAVNHKNGQNFSKDEIHDHMRVKYLGQTEAKSIGSVTVPPQLKSTKKLTKGEMFFYMQQIEEWAIGAGIILPHPDDNEYYRIKLKHESGK
jgi:hypothetical protein